MMYRFGALVWYGEQDRAPSGAPTNPALATVASSPHMAAGLYGIAREARALWAARVPHRTGNLASSTSIYPEPLKTVGSDGRRIAVSFDARADYAAAVEFGRKNLATHGNRRPPVRTRVKPGQFPPRVGGRHVLGGDNRRLRSVVTDIERLYGGR
ncbi:HK97 gp10 family phage protein [Nocardia pseudobrasiliensis]|uniref:Uncharacterized protein n=1 Tax=Nocardia pseudobrasiliensis TaxID=45979 RepID=A0A370I4T6_9NOCA|nr:HK97 gp10 family phage protein [Nocardia pseudobrasiliensis]RDI65758.1 hypothetical protein DFR76_10573 [Nocardia pseudobrasiliensis]